jgi:hypothetical protein
MNPARREVGQFNMIDDFLTVPDVVTVLIWPRVSKLWQCPATAIVSQDAWLSSRDTHEHHQLSYT